MEHTVSIDEGERQVICLALAKITLERPGWQNMIGNMVVRLGWAACYNDFIGIHSPPLEEKK